MLDNTKQIINNKFILVNIETALSDFPDLIELYKNLFYHKNDNNNDIINKYGIFLYINKDVIIDSPIKIDLNYKEEFNKKTKKYCYFNIFIFNDNSKCKIEYDIPNIFLSKLKNKDIQINQSHFLYVKEKSQVNFCYTQNKKLLNSEKCNFSYFSNMNINQKKDSNFCFIKSIVNNFNSYYKNNIFLEDNNASF